MVVKTIPWNCDNIVTEVTQQETTHRRREETTSFTLIFATFMPNLSLPECKILGFFKTLILHKIVYPKPHLLSLTDYHNG